MNRISLKLMIMPLFLASLLIITIVCGKNIKYDYLVLVNQDNKLPDNWEEIVELSNTTNSRGAPLQVEKETLQKFNELKDDLAKNGVLMDIDNSYRSVGEQEKLWDEWTKEYGLDYVKKYVAVPGYSEHHTGLAIDVYLIKNGKIIADNDEMMAESDIFAKIHEKLAEYGFILRYLKEKENITGYSYEPWHFRYVGSSDVAKNLTSHGITLEEYLENK